MGRVFISYRRSDSISITGRIYDRFVENFGEENVFKDVDDIPLGTDFREIIKDSIQSCDAVLIIMGQSWGSTTTDDGRKRLDDPTDFVRIEVETGLQTQKLIVPILVSGATMPHEDELPSSLRDLLFRNAATIRDDPDFNRDVSRLIEQVRKLTLRVPKLPEPQPDNNQINRSAPRLTARFWILILGVIAALLIIFLIPDMPYQSSNLISLDLVAEYVKQHDVGRVEVRGGQDVNIELKSGQSLLFRKERETNLFEMLQFYGVTDADISNFSYTETPINDKTGLIIGIIAILFITTSGFLWIWSRRYEDFVRKEISVIMRS